MITTVSVVLLLLALLLWFIGRSHGRESSDGDYSFSLWWVTSLVLAIIGVSNLITVYVV